MTDTKATKSNSNSKDTGENKISIGGNVSGSNIVAGNNNVIRQTIRESFNKADGLTFKLSSRKH